MEVLLDIALVTRNRSGSLQKTLESLRSQEAHLHEIIVSDDSDPQYVTQNQEIAEYYGCRHITGPQRGLYANRNHAALACHGTHIRTMDDDHLFPSNHFTQCLEAIHLDPNAIWTTGERGFVDGKLYGTALYASQLGPSGVSIAVRDPDNNWSIADGSTIYPRRVFDLGYRMFELFSYGSSYLEFGAYLYRRGFKSRCIKNCFVEHYPPDLSILSRGQTPAAIESSLFSSICYNLYFNPNFVCASRYFSTKIYRLLLSGTSMESIYQCFYYAKQRWSFNGKHKVSDSTL